MPPLPPAMRGAIIGYLRACLDDRPAAPPAGTAPHGLWVTLYDRGQVVARGRGAGPSLASALQQAVAPLTALPLDARRRGRLKVDIERGRAPMITRLWPAFVFGVMPGQDGLIAVDGDAEAALLPDDLLSDELLRGHHPFGGVELDLGLDTHAVVDRLRQRLATPPASALRLYRVHTDGFVESATHDGRAFAVVAGVPQDAAVEVTPAALDQAAVRAGDYLLRHLLPDGSFDYEYDVADPAVRPGGYSLPRHAGAVYFLARLYRRAPTAPLKEGIQRALWFLVGQARAGGHCDSPTRACVGDEETADLGATALALVAVAEFQDATGDQTFASWAGRLARFLLFMQEDNGDFYHLYDIAHDRRDVTTKLLYYSGEAALALARWGRVAAQTDGDSPRFLHAAEHALHYLTVEAYAPLAGAFVYGEDHWTCQAAASLYDAVDAVDPAEGAGWAAFCDGFARFVGRMQVRPGDAVARSHPNFVGAYGFGPFLPPHTTPVGSRSESLLATIAMDDAMAVRANAGGHPAAAADWAQRAAELRGAVRDGMAFLLAHQLNADRAYLAADPDAVEGALQMSDVQRLIRIDTQQHCGSAMLSAARQL